jgi:RNA recognition motif-containing protein
MEDDQAATAAMSALDNQDFGGRNLKVNEAKERQPRNNYRY